MFLNEHYGCGRGEEGQWQQDWSPSSLLEEPALNEGDTQWVLSLCQP